jgi:hypothetical protein
VPHLCEVLSVFQRSWPFPSTRPNPNFHFQNFLTQLWKTSVYFLRFSDYRISEIHKKLEKIHCHHHCHVWHKIKRFLPSQNAHTLNTVYISASETLFRDTLVCREQLLHVLLRQVLPSTILNTIHPLVYMLQNNCLLTSEHINPVKGLYQVK